MNVSDTLVISTVVSLVGAICYLAKLINNHYNSRIDGLRETITQHGEDAAVMRENAKVMRDEINRLSKGCGLAGCKWSPYAVRKPKSKD